MPKFSTGLRQALLVTGPFRDVMSGSEIRFYSGPVPAHADEAISIANVLLCTVDAEGAGFTFEADAPDGVLSKSLDEVLKGENVVSGVASFFRQVLPSDTSVASSSALRVQGSVGVVGTDIQISDVNFEAGAETKLDYYFVAMLEE